MQYQLGCTVFKVVCTTFVSSNVNCISEIVRLDLDSLA